MAKVARGSAPVWALVGTLLTFACRPAPETTEASPRVAEAETAEQPWFCPGPSLVEVPRESW